MSIQIPSRSPHSFISVTYYQGNGGPVIVIAGGTGISRKFYGPFAQYLSSFCSLVVTFDYQGTSRTVADLKKMSQISIKREWANDTAEVVKWASAKGASSSDLVLVAHSVGGHIVGFLDDEAASLISRILLVSVNNAYWRWQAWGIGSAIVFPFSVAASTHVLGYYKSSLLGLGLDLPSGIARQWSHWTFFPEYMRHNPETAKKFDRFPASIPIEAIAFSDDELSSNLKAFEWTALQMLPNRSARFLALKPTKKPRIGHFGFFREQSGLWFMVKGWIQDGTRFNLDQLDKNLVSLVTMKTAKL